MHMKAIFEVHCMECITKLNANIKKIIFYLPENKEPFGSQIITLDFPHGVTTVIDILVARGQEK